jgi:hypothetical protein
MAKYKGIVMEFNEKQFRNQLGEARNIETIKLQEWSNRLRQVLPVYVIEYLFHKKSGVVAEMLKIDENIGFVYDPATLKQGIDMLVKIAEGQTLKGAEDTRLQGMYANFADPVTRVTYLKTSADQMDVYATIGDVVVKDLKVVAAQTTDEEMLEILQNRIRNVEARTQTQRRELQTRYGRQPQ